MQKHLLTNTKHTKTKYKEIVMTYKNNFHYIQKKQANKQTNKHDNTKK